MTDALFVRDAGEGPVALLLHAFPLDGRLWGQHAEALVARGWRVIVPDLPGLGASRILPGDPSLPDVAASLLAWLDDRGISAGLIAGCSLGGYVAMALARQRPSWPTALVLTGTKATADTPAAAAGRERLAELVERAPDDCARTLRQAALPGLVGSTTWGSRPDVFEMVAGWLDLAEPGTVAWYQRAMAVRPDSRDVLAAAEVPALLLWGEEDALSPRSEQEAMLAAMPGARLAVLARAGHLAIIERPAAAAAVHDEFVAQVRPQQPS
ncbi:MAG: alpha/beta fold hydrolase [Actinomycetota bacterium]|nr:alpha/beta fold hydrolase [Actinomycetota bacterium]